MPEPATLSKRHAFERVVLSKATVLRSIAFMIILSLLLPLIAGVGGDYPVARVFGKPMPPVAAFTYTVNFLDVSVDGSTSSDQDGTISSYDWTWGDGTNGTGVTATHVYATAGAKTIALTVTDNSGLTNSTSKIVTVSEPPKPPVAEFTYNVHFLAVSVDGFPSSDPDGTISSYAWTWGDGTTETGMTATHTYATEGAKTITLTVTDNSGLTNSTSKIVDVSKQKPNDTIFDAPVMVNDDTANNQQAPVIIGLPGRELFVAWQDSRSGDDDIYVPKSHATGTDFAPNKRADDSLISSKQVEPAATATANGTILLTWQDNRRSVYDYDIYFAKSYDGGATFTRNLKVDDSNSTTITWQERPSIAVTSGGAIFIAWTDDRGGHLRVRGASSFDGGATFSTSKEIASSVNSYGQTGVALVSNGDRIFAAFTDNTTDTGQPHPYVCISTDGGKTFTAPKRLDSTGSGGGWQRSLSIAPMPDGGIVAVWGDGRGGNEDIYASIASSNGTLTTSDFRVDDDSTGAYQLDPSVATDKFGNIFVVWQDERDLVYAIRYAHCIAGRTQFSVSTEVSSPGPLDIQRRPAVVSTDPGTVFVTWQDDRRGTYDVYASMGEVPYTLGLVTGWNFVSFPRVGNSYKASTLGLTNGDTVAKWNPATRVYTSHIVGVPVNDFAILPNTGYWINVPNGVRTLSIYGTVPTTTQQVSITVPTGGGWASVGFLMIDATRHAKDVPSMYSIPGSITTVSSYNPVTKAYTTWVSAIPDVNNFALVPGQAYWILCRASGMLTYTVEPGFFSLGLVSGWNFVSAPRIGYGYKASTLGLLAGDTVAQWNSATRVYQSHIVGIPVNDFVIAPSTGYWINVPSGTRTLSIYGTVPTTTQSKTITVPAGGGWAIIGFAGLNMTRHARDIPAMYSIPGNITTVASYNPVTKAYTSWLSIIPSVNNFLLVPGQAYWILVGASGTLTYIP
jgi:PKD repeat protein